MSVKGSNQKGGGIIKERLDCFANSDKQSYSLSSENFECKNALVFNRCVSIEMSDDTTGES